MLQDREPAAIARAPELRAPRLVHSSSSPAQRRPFVSDVFRKAPGVYIPGAVASTSVVECIYGAGMWRGFLDIDGATIPWTAVEILQVTQDDIDGIAHVLATSDSHRCIVVAERAAHGLLVPDWIKLVLVDVDEATVTGPSIA